MSARLLWEGAESAAWARRLDGRTKVCLLLMTTLLVITVDQPVTLFLLFSAALGLHIAAKTSWAKWEMLSVLIVVCLWGAVLSQALFYAQTPRSPLACLLSPQFPVLGEMTGGIFLYREGLSYGAIQGMRSATMLCIGLFVCWSSDPRSLVNAFVAWNLPPMISFMTVTALRFLPVLASEGSEIMTAARLREQAAGRGMNAFKWLRLMPKMVYPLLARSLRRAQTLSLSVLSRGFVHYRPQTVRAWPFHERCLSLAFLGLAVVVLAAKAAYMLSVQNIAYFPGARTIYDIARLWL